MLVLPHLLLAGGTALCPHAGGPPAGHAPVVRAESLPTVRAPDLVAAYDAAVRALPLAEVKADLRALMRNSQEDWPADYGFYGPLFVRLAWHCSGSYRISDGRGGCSGGRQRFDPERSWADNTNLDKARSLLWPLKKKYGAGLSWGDLFILAGTTALEEMGAPTLGVCLGRMDDDDNTESLPLGPSQAQRARWPCAVNGTCQAPLGTTTVGLIYVDPEGPMGVPHADESAPQVRDTFLRMSMNDSETVALIGGGHATGKAHGACPSGPGPSPWEDPAHPWPGACGSGKGADAFTSGMEGPWTTNPTRWDNSYFSNLLTHKWQPVKGPGGHWQWHVAGRPSPVAPSPAAGGEPQPIMMLTTDVALTRDPAYSDLVAVFAKDPARFDRAWKHAWYKLTTRDMGPAARCVGPLVPEPQPWQNPLPPPPPPAALADFGQVAVVLRRMLGEARAGARGSAYPAAELVRLAWRCAATLRVTDFRGGCNGARIRFEPETSWPVNAGLGATLAWLAPVKAQFDQGLSWADLIVLGGQVALEAAGAPAMSFCGARTDAADGSGSAHLEPVLSDAPGPNATLGALHEAIALSGLSAREWVALSGRRALGEKPPPFEGKWTRRPHKLTNEYYVNLVELRWVPHTVQATGAREYRAEGQDGLYMLQSDLLLTYDPELLAIVMDFAADEAAWLAEFARAWTKLVTADRFDGPGGNVCRRDEMAAHH